MNLSQLLRTAKGIKGNNCKTVIVRCAPTKRQQDAINALIATGNQTAAAKALGVTQGAISKRKRRAEQRLERAAKHSPAMARIAGRILEDVVRREPLVV